MNSLMMDVVDGLNIMIQTETWFMCIRAIKFS